MDIILYLLNYIQDQHKQICWLLNFICRYIPLKQWAFDDSHSPKYQKFKVDKLPVIKPFIKQNWQSGLSWMPQAAPFSDIRSLTTAVSDLVSLLCGWLSVILQNCPKTLNSALHK